MNREQAIKLGEIAIRLAEIEEFVGALSEKHFEVTYKGAIREYERYSKGDERSGAFWWMHENFDMVSASVKMIAMAVRDTQIMADMLWEVAEDAADRGKL
jgi:hypothetical protein